MTRELPPRKDLPAALEPGPCSGVSQGQQENRKTKTVPRPFTGLSNRLRCFDYQSIRQPHYNWIPRTL